MAAALWHGDGACFDHQAAFSFSFFVFLAALGLCQSVCVVVVGSYVLCLMLYHKIRGCPQ